MSEQDLANTIFEQHKLIDSLKNAIVQRDLRIGQLELVLSKALVSKDRGLAVEASLVIQPPPPASHPVSPLISAETKGLYSDGWTASNARLVFHPGVGSGGYQITFWLPKDAVAKTIRLHPGGGGQRMMELQPGQSIVYNLAMPNDVLSPSTLQLKTDRYGAKEGDLRDLGVVLVRVVWVDEVEEG